MKSTPIRIILLATTVFLSSGTVFCHSQVNKEIQNETSEKKDMLEIPYDIKSSIRSIEDSGKLPVEASIEHVPVEDEEQILIEKEKWMREQIKKADCGCF